MPYYAVHELKRYKVKLANNREEIEPKSYDFSIAPDEFETYEKCLGFCSALNIYLRGNVPLDDSDEDLEC